MTNGHGFIKNRVDIDERPVIVDEKVRFGDLEIGKNHRGALLTINVRVTGLVWIRLFSGKEANPLMEVTVNALKPFMDQIHTIRLTMEKNSVFTKKL